MYKYLNSILMYLGLIVLAIGLVNPGIVIANDEPSDACTEKLTAEGYLKRALFHINRGTERLKSIKRKDATETLIHSAGYKTAGDRLVKAWQHMSCAKIITPKKIVEDADGIRKDINTENIMKTEMALFSAAKELTEATKADSDYVRINNLKALKKDVENLPGSKDDRLAGIIASYTAFEAVGEAITKYRKELIFVCEKCTIIRE